MYITYYMRSVIDMYAKIESRLLKPDTSCRVRLSVSVHRSETSIARISNRRLFNNRQPWFLNSNLCCHDCIKVLKRHEARIGSVQQTILKANQLRTYKTCNYNADCFFSISMRYFGTMTIPITFYQSPSLSPTDCRGLF